MAIKYPVLCDNNASRFVFCIEAVEKLRLRHNANCPKTYDAHRAKGLNHEEAVYAARMDSGAWRKDNHDRQSKLALHDRNTHQANIVSEAYWSPVIADAIKSEAIVYPGGLNQSNEASKFAFLFELKQKLIEDGRDPLDDVDIVIVQKELKTVLADTKMKEYWKPDLGDIA